MQQLILKDEHDDEFMFLIDLITTFTKNLDIEVPKFYKRVSARLDQMSYLKGMEYNSQGVTSFEEVFAEFKKQKAAAAAAAAAAVAVVSPTLYVTVRYLDSLSRILSLMYKESSKIIGEERAISILKDSFGTTTKKYNTIPDLVAYIPQEVIGVKVAAAAAAFGTSVADNMLNFIADIYEKKMKVPERVVKERKPVEVSKEQIEEQVRDVFVEIIGPMGRKRFDTLERVDSPTIMKHINEWQRKGLLDNEKADNMRNKIRTILGGGIDPAPEVKKLYSEAFGAIGEDLFIDVEGSLNVNTVIKHMEELASKGILKSNEAEELKNKIKDIFRS
jgi:hypothetical protein